MATGKERLKNLVDEGRKTGKERLRERIGEETYARVTQEYYDRASSILGETIEIPTEETTRNFVKDRRDQLAAREKTLRGASPIHSGGLVYSDRGGASKGRRPEADIELETKIRPELDRLNTGIKKYEYNDYLDDVKENTFAGRSSANFRVGQLEIDSQKAWDTYIKNPTEENKRYAEYIDSIKNQYALNNEDVLNEDGWLSKSAASYLPQFLDQARVGATGAVGGAGGALALNATGVLAGLPEEIVTVPFGIKAGIVTSMGKYSHDMMRAAAFRELIYMGVDEETARAAASDEGIVSGLIEMADTGIDIATLGVGALIKQAGKIGVKNVAKQVAKKGTEEVAESALKKVMVGLGKYGVNIAAEGAQEGIQEIIGLTNEERALAGETGLFGLVEDSWNKGHNLSDEELAMVLGSAREGARISAMFGGATMGVNAAANAALNSLLNSRNAGTYSDDIISPENVAEEEVEDLPDIEEKNAQTGDFEPIPTPEETIPAQEEDNTAKITEAIKKLGDNGAKTLGEHYDFNSDIESYTAEFSSFYEAGKSNVPENIIDEMETTLISPDTKKAAYFAGQNDANVKQEETAPISNTENVKTVDTNAPAVHSVNEETPLITFVEKPKSKKGWAAADVEWRIPNKKTPIAYSTRGDHGLIETLADEYPSYTISELLGELHYAPDARKVLQQYIDAGYGDQIASEWFGDKRRGVNNTNKTNEVQETSTKSSDSLEISGAVEMGAKPIGKNGADVTDLFFPTLREETKEETNNGKSLEEVSDGRRVLEPSVHGQSDGGLLDTVASEDVQEDEGRGNTLPVSDGNRIQTSGPSVRPDETGTGRGRSVGSSEGRDLQPSAREITDKTEHVPLNTEAELDKAVSIGSGFAGGKQRIFEFYKTNPSKSDAIEFLKKEYGTGGRSYELTDGTRAHISYDAKGIRLEIYGDSEHLFKWPEVEKRIRTLVSEGKYYDNGEVKATEAVTETFGTLSFEEESALTTYKSGSSYMLNAKLREGIEVEELDEYEQHIVKNLDSALEKLPTRSGIVYRNISFDWFGGEEARNEFLAKHDGGDALVHYEAYTSASTDVDGYPIEGEYVVHMEIESVNGKDMEGHGDNFEKEVLFARDTYFIAHRIEYAEDGTPTIFMTEVANEERGIDGIPDRDHSGEQEPSANSTESEVRGLHEMDEGNAEVQSVSRGDSERHSERENELPEVPEKVEEEIEQKTELATQESPRGNNFYIPETGLNLPRGEKSRFKANVDAIKTLRTIMAENRYATPAEQEILSKYVGWGGLANAFDEKKTDWAKEYKQLKELLSEDEYSSARSATLSSYFTEPSVIRAIYKGLEGIGFKGGRLLEPSAGIGHFVGAMPQEMLQGVKSWTMVELDNITGNIAKYLYPNADVRVQGFENAKIPDNYMDAAISNVPFGNFPIVDKTYPKEVTGAIHNYFFAKSLDKVRPGGVVCFITSRYTMDGRDTAVREYISKRADLLGAIRLPDTAFKGNAGTEVVTDILVFKKREEGTPYSGEDFFETGMHHARERIYDSINNYFGEHPEMILGTPESTGGMYRGNNLTYKAKGGDLAKQIEKAFSKITGKMEYPVRQSQEEIRAEIKQNAGKAKNGSIVKKDGKLYRNNDGTLEEVQDVSEKNAPIVSSVIEIRDVARELLDLQLDDADSKKITEARKKLNTLYDGFVKKYGIFNSTTNKKLIGLDADAPFIMALEDYNKDTKKAKKAAIFTKNTISPVKTVTSVNTIEEGLIVSMNETGNIDPKRIAELLGESEETVTRTLLEHRLAFKNRNGELETAEQYLSGNVKAKLRDAEALVEGDSDYNVNIEELKKIIPADIPAEDIYVQPGSTWIPDSIYSDFVAETLGDRNTDWRKVATVAYNKLLGTFSVTVPDYWIKQRPENTTTWGTPDRTFLNIFEATLNNKNVTVTRKTEDGTRYVDKQATAAAQEKQEKIREEFIRWLWDDDNRKETLVKLYNDVFNNTVTPKYDGTNLTVNGANAEKPLRPHQKDAVQRIITSGGNTLLAHKVGAGKTYEMAAAAMKLRQLGIVKKPMFVVPKSLVAQWGNEFLDFFPAAKILVLGEKDFSAANRKLFANRIATGDYDAVILSQEQFKAVPMSSENQEAFYKEQIDALELAILEAARINGKRDPSIKQMERSKKSFEAKLKKLSDVKRDEDNIDFEQLGVDALFVDEAHSYKNLFYTTNMSNVSGLGNKEGSQKAFDLYMKVRHLQKLNGGRGIVFATATPVMNSMSEMYIMQKYLQNDMLEARGINSFDAWANQFGEVRTVLEMNPSGKGFRQKQSFSRFKNLAELQQMFRSFADVLTEIPGLQIPTMKEGKRIIVESEPSDFQMEFIDELAKRADDIKNRKVDPSVDNMLKVTSDGRKLSYTQRMIDPSLPYEEGNKILKCAENVVRIWEESKTFVSREGKTERNGTQLIFCDLSTPKGSSNTETTVEAAEEAENISIYDDIRNMLIASGIPAKEIAFIHDANTNEKKAKLFEDVNEGKVRILIGSTGKMGVGMNAQKRIVALHHLDAPWRPGDIEQREGRALRQGNLNDEVGMYVYVTKKTFDSRMWDNLQRKATFIHQVMAGDLTARESEGDGDFALSAAEIKAISSGNPLIMEQFEVAAELAKVENLERAHRKEVSDAKKKIETAKVEIASDEIYKANIEADLAIRKDTSGDKFSIVINGKTYTERKAAGEQLIAEAKKHLKLSRTSEETHEIGTFAGFKLAVTNSGDVLIRGKGQYRTSVNMDSAVGTIQSLEATAKKLDKRLETVTTRLSENKNAIAKLERVIATPFARADELTSLRKRNAEIMAELNPAEDQNIASLDEDDVDNMVEYDRLGEPSYPERWETERVGDTEKAPMRISEIVEKVRHDFGLNVTTGHIRGKNVRGQYDRSNKGIRTKIANDLPTLAHELGHALDHRYKLIKDLKDDKQGKAVKDELKKALGEGKDLYPKRLWHTEGFAEYIRYFLQNRETAAIDYPEVTKYMLNSIPAKDVALLEQLADEINAYYSLDADTATSSIRLREEKNPDARTVTEKIKAKASVLSQAWLDSNKGIKEFDKATGANTYKLATNAAYSDAIAGQLIIGDLTDADGQYVGAGLKAALNGLDLNNKKEYRLFGEYLVVKHGPERLAEGMRIFSDDRKNSTTFMKRRQEELEEAYPHFAEISKRLYEFQKQFLVTWGVDTGLVSEESATEWAERWSFYVPLNRAVSEEQRGIGAKRGFANQNSTIHKAIGSGLDIVHPVDNIVNNIVKMVNAGVRNNVMREITNQASALDADASFLEKVPAPLVRHSFDMTKVKATLEGWFEESSLKTSDIALASGIVNNLDDILYQYGRGKAHGDVITVLKNGQPEFWKINDSLMLQSLTSLSPKKMEGILDAYAVVSRFMTSNITGNNLIWSLFSNFPRDMMTMFTYSKNKNPAELFSSVGSAYMNRVKGEDADPLYKEYLAMGGGKTSAYTADRDLAKRARKSLSNKKFSANPLDWIAFISDTVETGPRYATYKLMREAGMNAQEAFYESQDITVNFRRGGHISQELNKVVPFFNASVQGLDKFRRWITAEDVGAKERKKVVRSRVITYIAVSGAMAAIFYALNNGSDEKEEDYEQLSNYIKNSYWNIPLGDGKYFAIPKPRDLGVLSSFFETCMEYGIGKNNHAFDEFYAYAVENFLPSVASDIAQVGNKGVIETGMGVIGSLGIIGVVGYLGANRDFLGRPIVSSGLQNLEPKDQYTARTSKIAYWIGQAFDTSPMQVDYFFQQVLGGWWKTQKALFPVGSENIDYTLGVRNTYVKDNQYSTDLVNWAYDKAEKSKKAKNSDPENIDKVIEAKLDSNITTFYSRYYNLAKNKGDTTATRGTRQLVLDMINEYRKAVDSGSMTITQKAVNEVCKAKNSTEYLPGVMQVEVTDGNGIKHSLSDSQYVEYQTDYLRLYWEMVEETFPTNGTLEEKVAVLKAAKTHAQERATSNTLGRIGAPRTAYDFKYSGLDNNDVVEFLAGVSIANADGSFNQSEAAEIILGMDVSDNTGYKLFTSKFDSTKAQRASDAGIPSEVYMKYVVGIGDIKADPGVYNSRRPKVEKFLNSICDSYKEYLFFLGEEYESVKKDEDYIIYFGE